MLQLGNKLQKIHKKMARKPKETMRLIQRGLTERQQQHPLSNITLTWKNCCCI